MDDRDDDVVATDTLGAQISEWLEETQGLSRSRAQVIARALGATSFDVSTLAMSGREVGLSGERVRQLVKESRGSLRAARPAFSGVDDLRYALIASVMSGSIATASLLGRATRSPQKLAELLRDLGDKRLARLLEVSARDLDARFVRDARQSVHDHGAIALDRAQTQLAAWSSEREDIAYAWGGDKRILMVGTTAVSLRDSSRVLDGVRHGLAATSPLTSIDAYGACLRALRARSIPNPPTWSEFEIFLRHHPQLQVSGDLVWPTSPLEEVEGLEAVLLKYLEAATDGIATGTELIESAEQAGFSGNSALQYCNSSPVLDYVCKGGYRRRGSAVSVGRAEEVRRRAPTSGRWAQWGWLDSERFWVSTSLTSSGFSPQLPTDVYALLAGRTFEIRPVDRAGIGAVSFLPDGHAVMHLPSLAADFLARKADFEFSVGEATSVSLRLPIESNSKRIADTDGCVLFQGDWAMVLRVDRSLLFGAPCVVPAALMPRDMLIGEFKTISIRDSEELVRLRLEPKGGSLSDLGLHLSKVNVTEGEWVRIDISGDYLQVTRLGVPTAEVSDMLRVRIGIPISSASPSLLAVAASALGLPHLSHRSDVYAAFIRRGRPDLGEIVRNVRSAHVANKIDPSSTTEVRARVDETGDIQFIGAHGTVIPRQAVPGQRSEALGLSWVRASRNSYDPLWTEWVTALIRVLLAGAGGSRPVFERGNGMWMADGRPWRTLLEAWQSVVLVPGIELVLPPLPVGTLPTTAFGFVRLFLNAVQVGLEGLSFYGGGVVVRWSDGSEVSLPLAQLADVVDGAPRGA